METYPLFRIILKLNCLQLFPGKTSFRLLRLLSFSHNLTRSVPPCYLFLLKCSYQHSVWTIESTPYCVHCTTNSAYEMTSVSPSLVISLMVSTCTCRSCNAAITRARNFAYGCYDYFKYGRTELGFSEQTISISKSFSFPPSRWSSSHPEFFNV